MAADLPEGKMAKVREVPSSSVYHQIFDAEVQLVRSLTKARRKASTRSRSLPRSLSCIPNQPVLTAEGRVQSIDNLRNIDFSKLSENEHEATVREVRDLPQTLVQRKTASNIVQRLNLRYSERHNEVLVQFGEDLSHISMDVEVELRQAGHSLMASLAEKEGDIEGGLAIMVREKHLENWTFQDFRVLWERVAQSWEAYRARIRETTQLFAQLEEMRATRISKAFGECTERLVKASFLTPREIWIFMDNEAMLVNQCLLANRWALARLTLQLLEGAVCGEARNHGCWQDHLTTWRDAHLRTALTSCRVYITAQPKKLLFENSELESMISQLNFLVEHRVKLVRDLMKMNPPEFSIALVSSWHSSIEEVNAVIDNLHTSLVSKMRVNCDELNFRCQEEIKRHQESLQALGVCDETKAQEIFVREFSPLAQARQISAEQAVESTKSWLQAAENRAVEYVKYLRKIADGAAALWQVLLNNAAFCEEKLQESWHVCQKSHECLQQKKEAIFQTLLKRLRQESSEKALNVALQKVYSLLSDTKAAHEAFHRKQEAILPLAAKERIDHCKALCKYFGLKVKSQQELNSGQENPEEMEQQDSFTTSIKNTFYFPPNEGRGLRKRLAETLCSGFLDAPSPSSIFPTKVLPAACVCLPYLDNAGIPEGIIITTECGFCQAFCEAVDVYCKNAEDEMCMLIEKHLQELSAEVSLQIQVNESRKAQIESETYNVRLGELVEHRRRLHLHCTTVQNGMVQLRTGHHALINEYEVHAEDLQKLLASFEAPLIEVCQMERFSKVIASLHADLDKHRESVRSIMPRFLQQRDSTMAQMMESNKRFLGSLKLFSNGENFSQEEMESSQKRLDKLEHKMVMDATSLVAKMSSTEAKWLERVTEQASKFEQRFKNHAVGVCFVECIQRQLRSTWIRVKAEEVEGLLHILLYSLLDDRRDIKLLGTLLRIITIFSRTSSLTLSHIGMILRVLKSETQSRDLASALEAFKQKFHVFIDPDTGSQEVVSDSLWLCLQDILKKAQIRAQYLDCFQTNHKVSATLDMDPHSTRPLHVSLHGAQPLIRHSTAHHSSTENYADPDVPLDQNILGKSRDIFDAGKVGEQTSGEVAVHSGNKPLIAAPGITKQHQPRKPSKGMIAWQKDKQNFKTKYQLLSDPDTESDNFKSFVRLMLKDTRDELFKMTREFYQKKGRRVLVKLKVGSTLNQCVDMILDTLLDYQAKAFESNMVFTQSFYEQLAKMEEFATVLAELLIQQVHRKQMSSLKQMVHTMKNNFSTVLKSFEKKKERHSKLMKPVLGRLERVQSLESLCSEEEERQESRRVAVMDYYSMFEACCTKHARTYVHELASLAEYLLHDCDKLIIRNDFQPDLQTKAEKNTTSLLQQQSATHGLDTSDKKVSSDTGGSVWPGLPLENHWNPSKPSSEMTPSVVTTKMTQPHLCIITTRDRSYQEYIKELEHRREGCAQEVRALLVDGDHWATQWSDRARLIKNLHNREPAGPFFHPHTTQDRPHSAQEP